MARRRRRVLLIAAQFGIFGIAAAADGSHPCAAIEDRNARLDCYDAAFGPPAAKQGAQNVERNQSTAQSTGQSTGQNTAQNSAQKAPESARADASQNFGFSAEQLRAAAARPDGAPASVTATIAALAEKPTGEFVATLDNDQVWVQRETNTRARLRVGDKVTLRRAALSSYFLVTPEGVLTRVRRVK